jgi:serine/threonine protein kinase
MEEISSSKTCPHCGYQAGSEPESLLHLPPGTLLQGKFLLGRVLGQGGFGITYLAWDTTLNIKLAIKEYLPQQMATRSAGQNTVTVYKSSLAAEFRYGRDKFLEEARTLARFNEHPNIVTVRDYFEANGTAYLVMNYHEGITLQNYLVSKGGVIPVDQALSIFMPVLDALKEVHNAGILHRDISPDNLLIEKTGRVILIDFGAARQAMGEKSKSLSVIMKAGYSPPEQYQSRGKQGTWTDIYSVAASFYRAINGQAPLEAIDRMAEDDLLAPSKLGIAIKPKQKEVLLKALAVKAEERYQTVEQFQKALVAPPATTSYTTSKRRIKTAKSIALIVLCALFLFGAINFFFGGGEEAEGPAGSAPEGAVQGVDDSNNEGDGKGHDSAVSITEPVIEYNSDWPLLIDLWESSEAEEWWQYDIETYLIIDDFTISLGDKKEKIIQNLGEPDQIDYFYPYGDDVPYLTLVYKQIIIDCYYKKYTGESEGDSTIYELTITDSDVFGPRNIKITETFESFINKFPDENNSITPIETKFITPDSDGIEFEKVMYGDSEISGPFAIIYYDHLYEPKEVKFFNRPYGGFSTVCVVVYFKENQIDRIRMGIQTT